MARRVRVRVIGAAESVVRLEEKMPVMEGPALVVVWADPGRMTGWSVHRVNIAELVARGQVGSVSRMWWRVGQFGAVSTSGAVDSYLTLCRSVWERIADHDVMVVGCEGFTLMMNSKDYWLLEPVRFHSVLVDRLRDTGMVVETQGAGEAKKVITDARLRSWGLYQAGTEHGRDAQRHGLLFLRRYASQPELRERVG
jgi:hypothetical protein